MITKIRGGGESGESIAKPKHFNNRGWINQKMQSVMDNYGCL